MTVLPANLARSALRRIAEQHLPPKPEHFTRLYYEAAGTAPPVSLAAVPSSPVANIEPELVEQIDTLAR